MLRKTDVKYFIGDNYTFNKMTNYMQDLKKLVIIDNITPIEIKNQLVKNSILCENNLIYVGFPRIFNYKFFLTGEFKNFLDEIDKIKSQNLFDDSFTNLHNDYVIELHNYCQVFYKLKQYYKFKIVDEWKVVNEEIKILINNEFYCDYVKKSFNKLIESEFDLIT
jgi:adenylate kinase family enzyme